MTYIEKVHKIFEELQTWDTELLKAIKDVQLDKMVSDILEQDRRGER